MLAAAGHQAKNSAALPLYTLSSPDQQKAYRNEGVLA